ncbi:uncharacterized protein BP5553_10304 [Venustampulla echinocandica]|uniref:Uncharacterized protein n=1 Tax=Venustampulla echinocandica TaxID=2656787 RepID=A0A370T9V5_9HELO|nr:uncharacterized protein BP5553_10304 [Venustampulla echinocandica]RDL30426.1 hypothetical protein BP5553_10304 [Venustampulla echinocandica]
MTPIQIPVNDTLETLQNVLKRRREAQEVEQRKVLSGGDYQQIEDNYNKTAFIPPLNANNTKASIYYTRLKWTSWICEEYIVPKLERGKTRRRKSVNQYWRDFKILYRRVNGSYVNANDSHEVVKFINSQLKIKYKLDNTPKPKLVAGADTLLLLLVYLWARDQSIFRTEGDRLDFACTTLFQAYIGGRPAEFVHASKSTTSQDPLSEKEKTPRLEHYQPSIHPNQPDSDYSDYEDNSEAGDEIPDEDLFDDYTIPLDEDERLSNNNNETDNERVIKDNRDIFITEDEMESFAIEAEEVSSPVVRSVYVTPLAGSNEEVRETKAICYEDICL